jgi:mannosyltransferase OCH1-like enzyme
VLLQPPIVWIDTWRKKYRSEYPGWDYTLWTDKEVAELPLRMKNLYDKEKMYQCKADLLRLEVLWMEGGVYIDADMVWLHKDLQDVLDASKDTGFFCGYEPDTKDKPYSVIGNSFIAATPKHPLVDMLIKYLRPQEAIPRGRMGDRSLERGLLLCSVSLERVLLLCSVSLE